MPQLRMFGRRWRASTDSLPVLAFCLFLVHLTFFVAVLILGIMIGGADYQCNEKGSIAAYLFGSIATICLLLIDDVLIFMCGLVGGPFEEKKRRPVVVGMYSQFVLIIIFTGFAIFGTVFVRSDVAEEECWSKRPCVSVQSVIADSCLVSNQNSLALWTRTLEKTTNLTPECRELDQLWTDGDVGRCLSYYLDLAGEYGKGVYNESARTTIDGIGTGPYNKGVNESAVTCTLSDNFSEISSESAAVQQQMMNSTTLLNDSAMNGTVGFGIFNVIAGNFLQNVREAEAEGMNPDSEPYQAALYASSLFPNLATNLGVFILGRAYGIIDPATPFQNGTGKVPDNYTGLLEKAPWYQQCMDTTLAGCGDVLGSTCNQWDIILSIDDSSDEKGLFLAAIGMAWASIAVSLIVYYLSFNSFTDYTSDETWIATVNQVGGFLGWSSVLRNSVTEAGFSASEELGVLLKKIFGGIDMDLTDRVLGAYLASERRDWRRLRTVVAKLETYGYTLKAQPGCMWGLFDGAGIDGYGLSELKSVARSGLSLHASGSESVDRTGGSDCLISNIDPKVLGLGPLTELPATPFVGAEDGPGDTTGIKSEHGRANIPSSPKNVQMSPETALSTVARASSTYMTAPSGIHNGSSSLDRSIEVAYSFVRLDSSIASSVGDNRVYRSKSTEKPKSTMKRQKKSKRMPKEMSSRLESGTLGGIKDNTKAIKLMVPVDLSRIEFDPPINSRDAARLCMDDNLGLVPSAVLTEALKYSWFAKAAYGLQTKLWKASATGDCTIDCIDGILSSKCFPGILGSAIDVDGRFKKRNFDAILEYTGIPTEDFLYVSYSNTTFGTLPFLVMLDRVNKKLIISIRGTAGLEDLITDLLSNPVDMNDMLPPSVLDALPPETEIYAHAGILSSAKAIIATLDEEGILRKIDTHVGSTDCASLGPRDVADADRDSRDSFAKTRDRAFSKHVSSLRPDMDVDFSLERAQTAVFDAVFVQNFDIVITGHSLGAAVASIVSVVLKEKYPNLRCYAFNPPGGLVSPALSELTRPYITSIIVGYDAISRLGIKNVKDLVDDMVFSLCRCKRPKLKIATDVLLSNRKDPLTAPKTYCSFDDTDDAVKQILVEYIEHSTIHSDDLQERDLVPLGTIVFLRPYVLDAAKIKVEWDAVYADPTNIVAEGILLRRMSFQHHRLPTVIGAIEACIEEAQRRETENDV